MFVRHHASTRSSEQQGQGHNAVNVDVLRVSDPLQNTKIRTL